MTAARRRCAAPSRKQIAVATAAASIKNAARFARITDPATAGQISYASLCGGLEGVLRRLVCELAGSAAAAEIDAAFGAAYDDSSDDAVAARAGQLRISTHPTTNASTR